MINLHNTSDEYHTANEDSFTTTSFSGSSPNRSISIGQQQQTIAGVTPTTTSGTGPPTTLAARKQLSPADPNEPAKPLSAYALFFRDTVSAIKQQNPTCSFQELSKIVASMWEALDPQHKTDYNKKHELAKNDYIKQMRIYRQQQAQTPADGVTTTTTTATNNNVTTLQQQQIPQTKPAVFTMNVNQQSNNQTQPQIAQRIVNNNAASPNSISTTIPSGGGEQVHMVNETETIQKCTRENCNKRAIINPDWEDEYCSNECVVIHCRNVFNAWVQSNLEAKQQQPSSDIQQTQGATT